MQMVAQQFHRNCLRIPAFFQPPTSAVIHARLGSEREADVELSGCSSELESELGQEKAQPVTKESGMKSASDEEDMDELTEKAQKRWMERAQMAQMEKTY